VTARPLDAARDALIALQGQLIVMLAEQNLSLAARVADLAERLARLERAASRNSGNSSLPPSVDDQPGRTPPSPQAKRGRGKGRRPGKQPGSPGSHLAWSENPDQTVPLFPRGACACGADLADAAHLGVAASHQQVDIPEMTARVIQHDLHEVACRCGRVHRAPAPPAAGMPGTVTYGISLQAWCVYLMAAHAIPVHRCAELIAALTGAEPSPGFVHGMLARAAAAVRYANALIRALIITAAVICADETPSGSGPARRPARSTCWSHARTCSPITSWATGPWTPSGVSCSPACPAPSSSTTGTRTTTSYPASSTSSAQLTCSGTSKTPPSPIRERSGLATQQVPSLGEGQTAI
jgi:transposase